MINKMRIHNKFIFLLLCALTNYTSVKSKSYYWDRCTDVTPGIQTIIIIDRDIELEAFSYNRDGKISSHTVSYIADTPSMDCGVWKNGGATTYKYDADGRLSKIESTEEHYPSTVIIEYGNHGMYVPFKLEYGEYTTIIDTRLVRDIVKIICKYSNGVIETHTFEPNNNMILHRFDKKTPGLTDDGGIQMIEFNSSGLPISFNYSDGHVGPVSYNGDGGFDSIPEVRQSSNNPLLLSSFIKYNPIVHAIERATYYNNGYKKTFYFKYNEKGNLIENFTDEDKKNYNYEYDANGNWVKKTRLVSLDNNQIIELNTIRIISYY